MGPQSSSGPSSLTGQLPVLCSVTLAYLTRSEHKPMRQLCVECASGSSVQNSHSSPCLHASVSLAASTGINTTFFRKVAKDWSYFRHRCVQWGGQSHCSEAPCDSAGRVWPAIKYMGQGLEAGRKVGRKGEGGFSASASGSGKGEEEGG